MLKQRDVFIVLWLANLNEKRFLASMFVNSIKKDKMDHNYFMKMYVISHFQ